MRPASLLGFLLTALLAGPASSQGNQPILEGILRAEDHRAASGSELRLLLAQLSSPDTLVLRLAIRALGRLERPVLAERLFPLLAYPAPGIRAEAAQAVAQAAQGYRSASPGKGRSGWNQLLTRLRTRVSLEENQGVRGMLALALGRLPYVTAAEIGDASRWLLALAGGAAAKPALPVARGMETLVRLTAGEPLPKEFLERLRSWVRDSSADPAVRRAALGGLLGASAADATSLGESLQAGDPQLRRLAVAGVLRLADPERERLLTAALADPAAMVRIEALRIWSRSAGARACAGLRAATGDSIPAVALLAVDLLGTSCAGDSLAAVILGNTLLQAKDDWHAGAHALLSLARVAGPQAARELPRAASAPVWQVRMYSARSAGVLSDTMVLRRLAADSVANVREAALTALHELVGHAADSLYRRALAAPDYQLVLTAAKALAASPEPALAAAALFGALDRITREQKETSRDPRVALLVRLRELGSRADSSRLAPYLRDFDWLVADSAARLLQSWTSRSVRATPRPLARPGVSLRELERLRGKRLWFQLASGPAFEVELLADEAPLTVLRVARLAAQGYYDGLSFHRVIPNFVIQGGSPGANEYAGAARFMRDELGALSHVRGTLGISTRGRDTGDAQLFVNLCDNPRLDYEYTVWGRIVSGMAAVDGILEGELIRRVEIRSR
jgi:cyclophilin family peptidyl-prolyl cis-trans isomerase